MNGPNNPIGWCDSRSLVMQFAMATAARGTYIQKVTLGIPIVVMIMDCRSAAVKAGQGGGIGKASVPDCSPYGFNGDGLNACVLGSTDVLPPYIVAGTALATEPVATMNVATESFDRLPRLAGRAPLESGRDFLLVLFKRKTEMVCSCRNDSQPGTHVISSLHASPGPSITIQTEPVK